MAWWFGFAAVAGAFGGLIAFGVQQIRSSVQNWRLLFVIEVSPIISNRIVIGTFLSLYVGYTTCPAGYRNYILAP